MSLVRVIESACLKTFYHTRAQCRINRPRALVNASCDCHHRRRECNRLFVDGRGQERGERSVACRVQTRTPCVICAGCVWRTSYLFKVITDLCGTGAIGASALLLHRASVPSVRATVTTAVVSVWAFKLAAFLGFVFPRDTGSAL